MKTSSKISQLTPLLVLLVVMACNRPLYHEKEEISGDGWKIEDTLHFAFDITDTVKPYNVIIEINHSEDYPNRNLWLFITTQFPSGKLYVDTFNCYLAAPDGKWVGSGRNGKTASVVYRLKVRFPETGHYQMDICQAMRTQKLKGVKQLGLRIEEAERKEE
jgi:gliding motility-associated lipoprotein GldH